MKSKFAFRCFILIILVNTIVSENVIFSNTSKFSPSARARMFETGKENKTTYNEVRSSADLQRSKSERKWKKISSDHLEPDSIVVTKVYEDFDIKFQSKLSWSGDILFGSILAVLSKK